MRDAVLQPSPFHSDCAGGFRPPPGSLPSPTLRLVSFMHFDSQCRAEKQSIMVKSATVRPTIIGVDVGFQCAIPVPPMSSQLD